MEGKTIKKVFEHVDDFYIKFTDDSCARIRLFDSHGDVWLEVDQRIEDLNKLGAFVQCELGYITEERLKEIEDERERRRMGQTEQYEREQLARLKAKYE